MFHQRYRSFAATALIVMFTGCLTIEEHYTFKKNGSGTLEYVVDMSEMGELIETFNEMDGADEKPKATDELGALDMEDEMKALMEIDGIKKVKLDAKEKWVQHLKFNFKDLDALNAALNVLMPDSTGLPFTFFRWENGTLVRTNNRHAYELGAGMARGEAEEDEDGSEMEAFLEAMKYRYSFKFANDITGTENVAAMNKENISDREVKFDTDWSVIANDRQALDLRIQLDR